MNRPKNLRRGMRAVLLAAACGPALVTPMQAADTEDASMINPLYAQSTLPNNMPRFDLIEDAHFLPAMQQGMREQLAEVAEIAADPRAPTFDNTIVAMELSGRLLERASGVFFNLSGADTNDALQAIQREVRPQLAAHRDAILLNGALFARVDALFQERETLDLSPEALRLLEQYHRDFLRAGAALDEAQKTRLREINGELARLGTQFSQNVLKEVNDAALVLDSREALAGLSDAQIESAAAEARERGLDDRYVLTLQNYSSQPLLSSLSNRETRRLLMEASLDRGSRGNDYDNRAIVAEVVALRAERAQLLGYETHADYVLEERTARTVAAVNDMFRGIVPVAVANARKEGEALQAVIDASAAESFELAAWDWPYYTEKLRQEKYDFDENSIKPFFELENVLVNGVFFAAEKLYGITFKARPDLPTYHPDVRAWEVFNADGSRLALFLSDYYARPSKRGGAWMNSYVSQSGLLGTRPVIANHLNISKPPEGEPTLLTLTEVTTLFHEFGHALHGMFSDVKYPSFAGTSVPRDFVEYPSQVNEMWATWPTVLENYARHYETGEPIPQALLERVIEAAKFNEGYRTTEYLAASVLDLCYHSLTPENLPAADDILNFEATCLADAGFDYAPVPPRYRSTYFSHIMGGYSAGYYSYIWSEVLDADSVKWLEENGGLTRANGDHFRDTLLSRGGSREAMSLFRDFTGRDPELQPLLERRGLTGES